MTAGTGCAVASARVNARPAMIGTPSVESRFGVPSNLPKVTPRRTPSRRHGDGLRH